MRIDTLLSKGRNLLKHQGSFSVNLDVRLLLQAATGLTHEDIVAEPQREVSADATATFDIFIARRLAQEPVSRILGRREFYGREFLITPDVLDPRPDTEVVVELALKHVRRGSFVDLGTGSGAIAVTLCAEAAELNGIASDISNAALDVARNNARRLGVSERLGFHQGSWFDRVEGKFDLIISNPPYVKSQESLPPDVANYDPHVALFAGDDGLVAYREIARQSATHLSPHGFVILEIGHDQSTEVEQLFETQGFKLVDKAQDLGGHIRGLAFNVREPY